MNYTNKKDILLYHYTNLNALVSIFSSVKNEQKITLWASNIFYLNDKKEVLEALSVINRHKPQSLNIDFIKKAFENVYITSFSECRDRLEMWNVYAKSGDGVAIAFSSNVLSDNATNLQPCIYGNKVESELVESENPILSEEWLNTIMDQGYIAREWNDAFDENANKLADICAKSKNKAFDYEKETRLITIVRHNNIKFRVHGDYLIPYIDVKIPREAVKQIIVGPTTNKELTRRSIQKMLQTCGYDIDEVKVLVSEVPLRK